MNRILLKYQCLNLFGLNCFFHTKDPREKKRTIGLLIAYLFIIVVCASYMGAYSYGLIYIDLGHLVPAYMILVASLLVLMFGMVKAGGTLFQNKGYEMLCALPISQKEIVFSRIFMIYIENILLTLLIFVPSIGVYAYLLHPSFTFYILSCLCVLIVPLIPMGISIFIGTCISFIASRMKHKNLVEILLTVILVVGIFALSAFIPQEGLDLKQLNETIYKLMQKIYPPCVWIGECIMTDNIGLFGLIFGMMVAVFYVTCRGVSFLFPSIMKNLHHYSVTTSQKISIKKEGMLKALLNKEFKRYFASSVYVTNTIMGPIMGVIMSISLFFIDFSLVPFDLRPLLPLFVAATFTMMSPNAVSISMEGKQWWQIKSLPIPSKMVMDAKLLFGIILELPFLCISDICLWLFLKPTLFEGILMILITLLLIIFANLFALSINTRFCQFDWENEVYVVKQSMASFIGGLGAILACIPCGLWIILFPKVKFLICIFLGIGIKLFYSYLCSIKLEKL